jgi:integrase
VTVCTGHIGDALEGVFGNGRKAAVCGSPASRRADGQALKTEGSTAVVPVIPFLQKILVAHQARALGNGYIFAGNKMRFSLNLDNLCACEIRPKLGAAWKGWHGFRRGLATNLFELGVPPKVAQGILRHSDLATTAKHYIVLESRRAGDKALRKLEKAVKRATDGQQENLVEFSGPTKAA